MEVILKFLLFKSSVFFILKPQYINWIFWLTYLYLSFSREHYFFRNVCLSLLSCIITNIIISKTPYHMICCIWSHGMLQPITFACPSLPVCSHNPLYFLLQFCDASSPTLCLEITALLWGVMWLWALFSICFFKCQVDWMLYFQPFFC